MAEGMLAGKVALVTGAGRGIGRAIALAMAAEGARLVVNDAGLSLSGEPEDERPADTVVREIRERGGEAVASHDSVAEFEAAGRIVEAALEAFGRLDVVVNNAGILRDAIFHRMTPEDFRAVIDVHLHGSFHVSRHAAGHFRRQGSGVFLHMTSTSGLIGNLGQANYMAAKLAIVGLSKAIALDMARFGVRSNCIAPFAWSRMIAEIPEKPGEEARLANLRRMTPERVAPLAVFLASDAAASVTGQIFAIRGTEVFLMSQSRPLRGLHRRGGWTPQALAEEMLPAFAPDFYGLDRSADVFSWPAPE